MLVGYFLDKSMTIYQHIHSI